MELLRGITGIQGRKEPSSCLPWSDLKAFRGHCHVAARTVGGKVERIEDPRFCNFSLAVIDFSDSSVAVLLNMVYPVVAFAKPPVAGQVIFEYIEFPKLAEFFVSLGVYTVMRQEELSRPLLRELCKNLAPSELKQVQYFRPARVGDLIFNWWDYSVQHGESHPNGWTCV